MNAAIRGRNPLNVKVVVDASREGSSEMILKVVICCSGIDRKFMIEKELIVSSIEGEQETDL